MIERQPQETARQTSTILGESNWVSNGVKACKKLKGNAYTHMPGTAIAHV